MEDTQVYQHLTSDTVKMRELTNWLFSLVDGVRDMLLTMGHERDKALTQKLMDTENHLIRAMAAMKEVQEILVDRRENVQ